jgi:hypothetical protein
LSAISSKRMRRVRDMLAPPMHTRQSARSVAGERPPRLTRPARSTRARQGTRAGVSARKCKGDGNATHAKWRKLHRTLRDSLPKNPRRPVLAASTRGLTPRERDGLDITLRQHPNAVAVDVSQSAGRMPVASVG